MIKNIIFDFGDIFINLDKEATFIELAKLGVHKVSDEMMTLAHHYEKGEISTNDFICFFQNEFAISKHDLVVAWNAILLDFPKHRLEFLKELSESKKYRLFLLSNTNELHIKWVQNDWGNELYTEFKNCFERFYLSHEIGFRKPNSDIYEFVLQENNLKAKETFFIDDTLENTLAAEKLGIQTWHLIPGKKDVVDLVIKKEFKV
ncbi:Alpha-D-glucose 1-phosphate phosphatase YihX [Polaribacter huanghezhanensis]|uniref:HAD family hydrolase n=1 Tax=Polaribacter huanghezhanensis TaxID=1354726 RepID=UPI002649BAF8|nr:HAD family phosphatase [Polaribacter huanghezhanensis]WKD84671.1 Alpha-D-glucose 1-phosphate phosphatase YihX [Polaribacter huanghezhanensis]